MTAATRRASKFPLAARPALGGAPAAGGTRADAAAAAARRCARPRSRRRPTQRAGRPRAWTRPDVRGAWSRACAARASASRACWPRSPPCRATASSTPRWRSQAYEDTSLPIGHGPDDLQALGRRAHARVAVRRRQRAAQRATSAPSRDRHRLRLPGGAARALAARVISIERLQPLHEKARRPARRRCASPGVRLVHGDGMARPCARRALRQHHRRGRRRGDSRRPGSTQLAVGGRLVAPIACRAARPGAGRRRSDARTASRGRSARRSRFVPLKSGIADEERTGSMPVIEASALAADERSRRRSAWRPPGP